MFPKKLTVLQIADPSVLAKVDELSWINFQFQPIQGFETSSQGWSPVRDLALAFRYMNYTLLSYTVQKKTVPASAVKLRVAELAASAEQAQGFKSGRKALKDLKGQAMDELMARAIPATASTMIWIDHNENRVLIDSVSDSAVGAIMALLYHTCELQASHIALPDDETLTHWLKADEGEDRGLPERLTADDFVTFEHPGEAGKTVRYDRADLLDADVYGNLKLGAQVTSLALTYDSKISFVLKDGGLLKIKALDVLKTPRYGEPKEDVFQNNFWLMAAETANLINYLKAVA